MAYEITSSSDSCYPGTNVLINKLGIRDQQALDEVESIIVTLHSAEIEEKEYSGPFSFEFYCSLHQRLFGDLYDWAGRLRTIDLSKKGTNFYPAADLQKFAEAKFSRLSEMKEFQNLETAQLLDEITSFYHELNMLHPFREGNGRTQRLFFTLLLHRLGYDISFADCDTDELMAATIYAAQGIQDYLQNFFKKLLNM